MMSQSSKIFLLLNIFSVIRASRLETVHFTNSANKILNANNFTTYKVDVPNGEPITIIEANVPLIDKKIKFNNVEHVQYSDRNHDLSNDDNANRKYGNKPVMDLETSLSMTVTPNNYDEYDNSEVSSIGEEENKNNDYSKFSPHANTMKTVYSPELLQKFLKDYANKVHLAGTLTPSAEDVSFDKNKHEDSQEQTNINEDDGNRRYSNSENEDKSEETEDFQERKNYRPGNHPYNKNSGWVTLDAVPWSKSKVSRWQSNQKPQNMNRPYRPPSASAYDYDFNGSNDNNDDFYTPKPSRPTYQNNQFYNGARPQTQESHSWHTSQQFHSSHGNNYDRPNRPSDIITDNRPSNFPNEENYQHHQSNKPQHNYAFSKPYNRPSSYGNSNDYSFSNQGNNYYSFKDGPHPNTYPQNGDGEWILVSTTKGYQYPKRNGQRAMSFKTQNSVGSSNNKQFNEHPGIITAAESQNIETVIRPQKNHYSHRPHPTKVTQQQAVKLTVLPLLIKEQKPTTSNRYGNNNYNDKVNVSLYKPSSTSSYHGIIESDQSDQTVEESVSQAQATAQKKKKKNIKKKNYALMRKNGQNDSSAVIAAVGASLLPASLGLIAPMVLGK